MSRLRLWVPLLLLTWQSLCLLVQAAQPPEWALDPAQLTADLLGPTEPWSSHSSEFPPESPQVEAQAQHPEPPEEIETSPIQQGSPSPPPEILKEAINPQEAPAEPSSTVEEIKPSVQQEASDQPTQAPKEVEPLTPQEAPAQPPEPSKERVPQPTAHEVNVPSLSKKEAQWPNFSNVTVKPVDLVLTVTLTQPPERTEEAQASPTQQEAPAQPVERPEEAVHSTALQQTLSLPEDPEVTLPHPEHVQAQQPHLTEVTAQPLDLELTVTPKPTTEFEHSTALKKTTAPPKDLEVTFAHLEQVQTQHPTLAEVTVQPLDLGLTITPEFTKETELSLPRRGTPIQPPEPPKEVVVAQSPVYQEEIVQTPGQDQAQHPSSPNVTVQPLDLELTVSPEPTKEVEQFTTLKKTTSPPKDLEVTLAHSEQVQSHRPTLNKVTVKPLDLELTITPESAAEVEPSPAMPEIPDQHPEPTKELVSQPHIYQEAAVPTPHQDQAQHWWSPNVTVQPLDLELTITPESTTEVKQSTTLQQTTTPPKDLEVTFPQSEQVQVQHPTLNKVTVKPLDLGLTITPEPTTETETSPTMQETP
ncbi:leucine-rich repeat-containing protein 37B-like, partial [Callorhinus ursinus]|uniref:leucine-rich repeat-containing protein 37B-like n=1 Tax=Callorhinus ursinus TaxID=34884 RepID=UPI003CD004EB